MADLTPTLNDLLQSHNVHRTPRKGHRPPLNDEFLKEAYTIVRFPHPSIPQLLTALPPRTPTSPLSKTTSSLSATPTYASTLHRDSNDSIHIIPPPTQRHRITSPRRNGTNSTPNPNPSSAPCTPRSGSSKKQKRSARRRRGNSSSTSTRGGSGSAGPWGDGRRAIAMTPPMTAASVPRNGGRRPGGKHCGRGGRA